MIPVLPYAIPVLTFLLGAALTLVLKSYEKRAGTIAMYVRDLSDAANEWYNQIHELLSCTEDDRTKKSAAYITNRLVLPRFLRSVEALRNYEEAAPVVDEADRLLMLLTISSVTDQDASWLKCLPVRPKANDTLHDDNGSLLEPTTEPGTLTDESLEILDRHMQAISMLSGQIASLGVWGGLGRLLFARLMTFRGKRAERRHATPFD